MLADDQVQIGIVGHAVAFVRRALDLATPRRASQRRRTSPGMSENSR